MAASCDQYGFDQKSTVYAPARKRKSSPFDISCHQKKTLRSRNSSTNLQGTFYAILFLITMNVPRTTAKEFQQFFCKFLRYKHECDKMLNETLPTNGTFCPGDFDGFMCWPHANASSLVTLPCPNFIVWNNDYLTGYRYCNEDGTWFKVPGEDDIWKHRDQCNPFTQSDSAAPTDLIEGEENLLNTLKTIYTIGYSVSLVCLVIALFLLVSFKKLHCTRNYIHINLMLSFMIRYIAVLVKDAVLKEQYSPKKFADDVSENEMITYCDEFGGTSGIMISCRIVIALMHYAVVANYFWLLVEGLYLLILLVFTMKDHKFFPAFMAFGWGGPWIPVGIWIVLHLALENVGCWELDETSQILWTLRAPIIISIAANFFIFIFIVRIIVSKLRAKNMTRNDYKYRLAKSTLALIPLLGIHYIVFIFVNDDDMALLNVMVKVKVAFEMVLTSIQGTLIALLYCFLNGEVRSEVQKLVNKWRMKHGLPAVIPRKSSTYNSSGTQVTTLTLHTGENNHKDKMHLSPTDKRNSTISGRRSTDTSGDQSIGILEGATEPLIRDSRVDIHPRKNDEFV